MVNVKKCIKQNRYIVSILVGMLVIGVIKANFDLLKLEDVTKMSEYINEMVKNRKMVGYDLVIAEFWDILKILVGIWLCGSSILGVPVVFWLVYMKGYVIGFCSGILIKTMGMNGLKLITAVMLPKEIFYIPIILILATSSIRFSIDMLNGKILRHKKIFKEMGIYAVKGIIFSIISLVVILLNASLELHLDKVICLLNF